MSDYVQKALDNEIKKRINHESPTKYDLDFYSRKINRLQMDNNQMHQELNKLRIRLRRAEDYELKYDLILKQMCSLQSELDARDKKLAQAKSKIEQFQLNVKQKQTISFNWQSKISDLKDQVNFWRQKSEEAQKAKFQIIHQIKDKQTLEIKRQIDVSKRQFNERQDEYQFQIRSLRKIVDQKQSVENIVKNRVEKIRAEKDEEINRLKSNMQNLKKECKETIKDKNQQIDQMRAKFEKMFNFQLENIHKSQQDQDQLFSIQMNGLRELIGIKNDQIERLLSELKSQCQTSDHERDSLNEQINILKETIYKIQRENQLELYALKQRLTKIQAQEIEAIEQRYRNMIESLKTQRKQLEEFIKEKDKILQSAHRESERIKADYIDRLKQRQARIQQLMDRIKLAGETNEKQMKSLHQSFHKIQSEKQIMTSEFQANFGFLNSQIAKQGVLNESKNDQIKKLHEEISRVKKQYNATILEIESRWKQERKQWQQSKDEDRKKYQDLQEKLRNKQRQWKSKEKHLQRQIDKRERQNKKLEFIIKEMQTDAERLNQYIKQLDESLKRQYKKNQMGALDNAGIRRQLSAELDRQKSELEAISRMQVDQVKKKLDAQMTHLKNQNEKLQTQLVKKNISCQNLEEQLKRLESLNKNIQIINKEKLIEYQKKMATINQQIALTQNLYQAFMETRARNK